MRTVAVAFILIATYAAGHDLRALRLEIVPGTPTVCECNVSR
jgi:hypothetical protein